MQTRVTRLHDIRLYPYYRDLSLEVAPVLAEACGRYVDGRIMHHQYTELLLDKETDLSSLRVGVPYSCAAVDPDGATIQTHWMYCTALHPRGVLGVTRDWRRPSGCAPLLTDAADPLQKLEKLTDLTTVYIAPPPSVGVAQAQIGQRGWLVMTCLTAPHMMGVLIEDPVLPPVLCEGSENVTISASSDRTLQVVWLDRLTCVSARGDALFLREVQ